MNTISSFLSVLANLIVGLYAGIFRKGEYFDNKTEHLSGPKYIIFVSGLGLVIIVGLIVYIRWGQS